MSSRIAFLLFTLLLLAPVILAQPKQPPPALPPERVVGNAKVYYIDRLDETRAEFFSYIQGTVMDIYAKKKEVIGMSLEYAVRGHKAVRPSSVYLSLTSYSAHPDNYTSGHKITIYVDGKEILSADGVDRYAGKDFLRSSSESYAIPRIAYSDFEKMSKAKKIAVAIGSTKIELSDDAVKGVSDLMKTIEN